MFLKNCIINLNFKFLLIKKIVPLSSIVLFNFTNRATELKNLNYALYEYLEYMRGKTI